MGANAQFGPPKLMETVEFIRENVTFRGVLCFLQGGTASVAVVGYPATFLVDANALRPVRGHELYADLAHLADLGGAEFVLVHQDRPLGRPDREEDEGRPPPSAPRVLRELSPDEEEEFNPACSCNECREEAERRFVSASLRKRRFFLHTPPAADGELPTPPAADRELPQLVADLVRRAVDPAALRRMRPFLEYAHEYFGLLLEGAR